MAPQLRRWDRNEDETLAEWMFRQRERISRRNVFVRRKHTPVKKTDGHPMFGWMLTIRGSQPAQIALEGEPVRQAKTELTPES